VPELGLVGRAVPSSPRTVLAVLASGRVPVVSPLSSGPLNVNADEAAAALAVGICAARIHFLTDVPGVYRDGELVESMSATCAESLVDAGSFEGGIVPKVLAAARAARSGLIAQIGATAVTA
jgi:acetylglutamate kinase